MIRFNVIASFCILGFVEFAMAAPPDTSEWKCEYCPFNQSDGGNYSLGVGVVSDDAARFGNGTGYDEEGAYPLLDGEGSRTGENMRLAWEFSDLGIDSRYFRFDAIRPGTYDFNVSYRGIPYRLFDSTSTVFQTANILGLPGGWTRSGLTSGFTELAGGLRPRSIESDRDILQIGGSYHPATKVKLHADYRRQEQEGVSILAGSFFTNASLLPRPLDYSTDEFDLGLSYNGDRGHAQISYYGSFFQNKDTALVWENPFDAFPGAERGAQAQPPDNSFSQVILSGGFRFDQETHLSVSAAFGRGEQDDALLNYSINPNFASIPLPRARLDGEIDTTNISLALTTGAIPFIDATLGYKYDERDNQTPRENWSRVVVDSVNLGETVNNIPYSFERSRFWAKAEAGLGAKLKLATGFERLETDRDFQEVAEQTEDTGWGRVQWKPNSHFKLSARGGAAKREIDRYDTAFAISLGQNPALRKYNLAHRFRTFGELTLSASLPEKPFSLSAHAAFANDDYSQSVLGLLSSDESRYSADLTWTLSEKSLVYINGGLERIQADQAGSEGFSAVDWRADHDDEFLSLGIGLHLKQITEAVDLAFDYTHGQGSSEIAVVAGNPNDGRFPDLESNLDTLRLTLSYRPSERLEWLGEIRYEQFETEDWALQGVTAATIPTILTLNAKPYDYDIIQVGLRFRYRFGN